MKDVIFDDEETMSIDCRWKKKMRNEEKKEDDGLSSFVIIGIGSIFE